MNKEMRDRNIAIVGLGYVGLQVAVAFGKKEAVIAYDNNSLRIQELSEGYDRTNEVSKKDLENKNLLFTSSLEDLKKSDFYIVAVPTPIDEFNEPDLTLLKNATASVSKTLRKNNIIVFESTVYPGATEEVCIPILEKESGLTLNEDIFVGYSPERINPGDKNHTFKNINKIVSASDKGSLKIISDAYSSVIDAEIYEAQNIKTAEAAKVIENTQRDLNIALINELAMLFKLMGLETSDVLEAASTKWNFLDFKPGLVGGHCVGVDPYYLTHKAKELGFDPQVILSGRKVNDSIPSFISQEIINALLAEEKKIEEVTINLLGITFKENCADIRNSKAAEIFKILSKQVKSVNVCDHWALQEEVTNELGISLVELKDLSKAEVTIIATSHEDFSSISLQKLKEITVDQGHVIDIKNVLPNSFSDSNLKIWKL